MLISLVRVVFWRPLERGFLVRLDQLGLLELRLRELLQLADGARHLRAVRRRELDDPLAVDLVLLLQADVAGVGNEDIDVLLALDAHEVPPCRRQIVRRQAFARCKRTAAPCGLGMVPEAVVPAKAGSRSTKSEARDAPTMSGDGRP